MFDTRGSFVSPFATSSTHLVFLSTNQPAGESPFHVLHYEGSILRLSPLGHEAEPDGSNLERKIKILLERSIAYWDREQQREKELLMAVITGMSSPMTRQLEKAGRPTWASTKFDKSIRVLPFLDFDGIAVKAIMRFQPEGNYWTVQLNLISETPEDLNKEKPPTMRVFGPTGVPIKVVGDGGFSEIDGVPFLMYRVEAKGHEEIALVEVEFNGIERQFELRKPEAIAEVNSQ